MKKPLFERDPITGRWTLFFPEFDRREVQAVMDLDVQTAQPANVSFRSLNDPELDLEIEEIQTVIAQGEKYGRHVPVDNVEFENEGQRFGIVHQVREKQYVFFVVFGTPKQISRYLRISLAVPSRYKKNVLPCILGWKLIEDEIIRADDPDFVPAKIVFSS